jgi:hypothetical protein
MLMHACGIRRTGWLAIVYLCLGWPALVGADDSASTAAAQPGFGKGLALFEAARSYAETHVTDQQGARRRYRAAAESFVEAWRSGWTSSEVLTNAANAFAFAGDNAMAVLFYRRALSVDPANARAQSGLEYLRSSLPIRKAAGGTGTSIAKSLFFWHEGVAFSVRRGVFVVVFPLAFVCFALALKRRWPFLHLGLALLVVGLLLLGSLLVDAFGSSLRSDAVVMTEVQGRRGDGQSYSPSHSRPFPPGTEVTILQRRNPRGSDASSAEPWVLVRLLDGKESWVPEGVVEPVVP